jgi:hypothetical protein
MKKREQIEVEVVINGSDVNAWHAYDLTCNPFPAVPKYEFGRFNKVLQQLDGDPIRSVEDLQRILLGGSPEFLELCVRHYVPGERTRFTVVFPADAL